MTNAEDEPQSGPAITPPTAASESVDSVNAEPSKKAPRRKVAAVVPTRGVPEAVPTQSTKPSLDKASDKLSASTDEEDEDEDEDDDDDDEDAPMAFTTGEAVGAVATVYRFIRPHLAGHSVGLSLVALGLLVETAFNVLMPLSLKFFIDEVLEGEDKSSFATVLIVLGVAGVITSITAVWYERKDAEVTSAIMADVRRRLFRHVQNLSAGYFTRTKTGEIVSRFSNDLMTIQDTVIHAANWGILPLAELVTGLLLLFVLAWPLALLALLIFPIALIGPRLIAPRAIEASYDLKRAQGALLGVVNEQVSAAPVVRAFGLQRIGRRWFGARSDLVRTTMVRSTFLGTMVERSVTISVLMLHLCVFGVGAWMTFNDYITLGAFVTFEGVFWEISYNVAHLMHFAPVMIHSAGAVRHIDEVLQQPVEKSDGGEGDELPRLSQSITFENVAFGYDEAEDAELQIEDLSLSVTAGRHVAIVGPSGAGKSTVIALLLRLYEPRNGRICIDGTDISQVSASSVRDQMAVVFQDSILFSTTILENIRLGRPEASDAEVIAAARAAEMHRFIKALPLGYNTIVGERGASLSGGQRQRIALARAVLRDPAILLLDEATSALDQTTESAILRTLRRVGEGRTMIFVTHRLTTVTDFDEILVMKEGRVVQRGTHKQLLARKGLYQRLWADQERVSL